MLIAEIMIVSDRSEVLVRKIYRDEAKAYNAKHIFSSRVGDINKGLVPPYFAEDGVHLYFIQRGRLYFVASSTSKASQIAATEFLSRLYYMAKDLCGTVTEESVRANQVPLFEMLHEAMDGGHVQIVSTEKLRPFIQSTPVAVQRTPSTPEEVASRMFGIERTSPVAASGRSAIRSAGDQKALYVDVVENLTAVTDSEGGVVHVKVEGTVNVNNFLQGHPTLKIAVNEDLQICRPGEVRAFGRSAQFDRCTFHQSVDTGEFDQNRILKIVPPDGQFSAMAYSVEGSSVSLPVRVLVSFAEIENTRDVSVKLRVSLNVPWSSKLVKLHIVLPLPASVSSVSQRVKGLSESLDFNKQTQRVEWIIRNMSNAEESIAQLRVTTVIMFTTTHSSG
ncbi:AP-4 complex subunit mu-1-like isoform X2 [Littorina saxatilis]|uniref:AP-4 complex subunit mu-1-like isoform X2 n=1 Tax=Littorina saxatilis TaxID=31220 RepID=UPI0038B61654